MVLCNIQAKILHSTIKSGASKIWNPVIRVNPLLLGKKRQKGNNSAIYILDTVAEFFLWDIATAKTAYF